MNTTPTSSRKPRIAAGLCGLTLLVSAAFPDSIPAAAVTVTVSVPGVADPWLAGMPAGSHASSCADGNIDTAPANSPIQVVGLPIVQGSVLTFHATGGVANGPAPGSPLGPPDGADIMVSHGAENGMSSLAARLDSLIGVFLPADAPDTTPSPPSLSFTSPAEMNFATLSPKLKQPFFIGDGQRDDGSPQEILVPRGAKRLLLGVMDGCGYYNNSGAFEVEITQHTTASLQIDVSEIVLSWSGEAGVAYQLQYRAAASDGPWFPLGEPVVSDGSVHTYLDKIADSTTRVYRLIEVQR